MPSNLARYSDEYNFENKAATRDLEVERWFSLMPAVRPYQAQ